MRLRLRVERNELPAVTTLWPVSEGETKHTIAQLLEKVNSRFPLESQHWGLEHYKVCVGGYECLHYHEIGAVCKDEDELVIRPLQTAERKARTLLGRDQISTDGRHLLDGVPFGRPLLREPRRSQIRIPPPKRQKLDHPTTVSLGAGDARGGDDDDTWSEEEADFNLQSDDEEDDEEEDESFHDDEEEEEQEEPEEDENLEDEEAKQVEVPGGSDDHDSHSDSSSEVSSASDESDESDEDSEDSDTSSWDGIASPEKSTSAQDAHNLHKEHSDKTVPPGLGNPRTKDRNRRRRDSRRLQWLKKNGRLPPEADLVAFAEYEARHGKNTDADHIDTNGRRSSAPNGAQHAKSSTKEALERKRQELLAQLASGGVDVTESNDEEPPEEIATAKHIPDGATKETGPANSTRRNRLDLAGTNRLLFGSLGVRVPRSQQEKDALQKKLAGRSGRNETGFVAPNNAPDENGPDTAASTGAENTATEEDPEGWRERIDLRAVECVDEGVSFSTPPFPFYQRWDPQQRKKKNRDSIAYMAPTKRRKTGSTGDFVETYDKYNQNGGSDALDYDDDDDDDDDDYWEEGALLGDEADDEDPASQQLLEETKNGLSDDPVAEGRRLHVSISRWTSTTKPDVWKLLQNDALFDDFDFVVDVADTHATVDCTHPSEARRAMHVLSRWKGLDGEPPLLSPAPGAQNDSDFPPAPQELPKRTISEHEAKLYDFLVYRELVVTAATNWQPAYVLRTVRLVDWNDTSMLWRVARPLRDQPQAEYDADGNRVYSKFEMADYYNEDEDEACFMPWDQLADDDGLGHLLIDWEEDGYEGKGSGT